ncbi:sialidase family protein [Algisphaera agarilytica]|uniref:Photosystem II stability/assembly factor-like uncharacterized protein n=1 Tax=Algisphaera agarilytica TaxID=1385975 RepID=A0A7X0H8T6_9BACT|nr:sialidase family protein [Algisphaera agarilytica]MBB6431336.1 photosystem II stability/assembly factor-like uncharacterized protein [Algisphaera agarilytica]
MSGYCEEFWCHPTDPDVMFMGPDMYVSYGTWDGGKSWHSLKDHDGLGHEMKRVLDIEFSRQDPDFGLAIDWNGWAYRSTDRGRSWTKIKELGAVLVKPGTPAEQRPGGMMQGYWQSRMGELAVDPTDDQVWYVGAGDFWNVKANHRSAAKPHGNRFAFGAYGFVLKTTNGGKSWKKITDGLPDDMEVGKIIVNPTNPQSVVMATSHGMMISDDGGLSWKDISKGLPNNLPRDLTSYYDAASGEFVLYAVEQTVYSPSKMTIHCEGGVFRSVDGGASWEDITGNLPIDMAEINFPATTDRFHRAVGFWLGISKQQAAKTITRMPSEVLPVFNRIEVNPLNKNEIYLALNKKHDRTFGPGDLWMSPNGGKNWLTVARHGKYWIGNNDKRYWRSRKNPTNPNIEFAHLQPYMDQGTEHSGNRKLAINSLGEVFIGVDQQTLKSTNKGKSWKQIDDDESPPGSGRWIGRGGSNLPGRFMLLETGIKDRYLLSSGEHGLWQTAALGNWPNKDAVAVEQIEGQVHVHGTESIATVAVHPNDPKTIYIMSWRQTNRGKLRRTTDGGKTWENIATIFECANNSWEALANQNSLLIDPQNPDNMFFCATYIRNGEISGGRGPKLTKGEYGFYRSEDGGYTWTPSNQGFHQGFSVRRLAMHPGNPRVLYAALNDKNGGLYRTTNGGKNWKRVPLPEPIKAINHVSIDRHNKHILVSAGTATGKPEEGGVWRSTDNGKTWKVIFKAPYVWQAEPSPVNPKIIAISVAGQSTKLLDNFRNPGIYLSRDGGRRWLKINRGLGQPDRMTDIKPDPYDENILWSAAWGSGWFKGIIREPTE